MIRLSIGIVTIITIICASCKTRGKSVVSAAPIAVNIKPSQIPHHPLHTDQDLDVLLQAVGDDRIVLLGEDTHGTSEYYTWRAAITKRLIQEKGFGIVALEADWSDTYRLNSLLNGIKKDSNEVTKTLKQFDRWPSWLWANEEFAKLLRWMNDFTVAGNKISIYGLDVYSFEEAVDTLIADLQDQTTLQVAQNVKQCLQPYHNDALQYQRAVQKGFSNCGNAVNRLWLSVNKVAGANKTKNDSGFLLRQNASVVFNGERYFRETVYNRLGAWNIRDRHMAQTVAALLEQHGSNSKIVVWAHNSHIGDANFTDMLGRGRSNMGAMLRKDYRPENVFIAGFCSYQGKVIAAQKWDTTYEVMKFAPARTGSIEQLLHDDGPGDKIILMKEVENNPVFSKWLIQRAIGVVENPKGGLPGNYVPSRIQKRYDAFVYFDETHPIHPFD